MIKVELFVYVVLSNKSMLGNERFFAFSCRKIRVLPDELVCI